MPSRTVRWLSMAAIGTNNVTSSSVALVTMCQQLSGTLANGSVLKLPLSNDLAELDDLKY